MSEPKIMVLEKGNFCEYSPRLDLIVISKCYYDDEKVRKFLLSHEFKHREIHKARGLRGLLHHVWLDWVTRFSFTRENYGMFKRIRELDPGDEARVLEILFTVCYQILTIPTGFIQLFADLMIYIDKRGPS